MVHVYNCHPFKSQQIVPTEQEPGLVCCGGDVLFVVSAGGCKIEAYNIEEEGCPLICRFATMGSVHFILHSQIGDYLVTFEEKKNATYLRAYTNWRYQAAEKARVGVRMLGHFLRGSSFRGSLKEQMEIIEIPLVESPLCVACCALTGDLLVGCPDSLVLFSLRRQVLSEQLSALDFERSLIVHVPGWAPLQVALCAGFVALQTELEVLVLKLSPAPVHPPAGNAPAPEDTTAGSDRHRNADIKGEGAAPPQDPEDFFIFPKHQELLGKEAEECGASVTLEWTGLETKGIPALSYVLYRRFAPDFFQGCSVEETRLHSLQLHPLFTGNQEVSRAEPTCVFCFFSLPNTGYMYSINDPVELISTYQYPEKAQQAVLTDLFLHIITRNALQCYSVRCSAVAARAEDPYIDTTIKACPPVTMDVCALRIQLFIGLKALCHDGNHVVVLTTADVGYTEEAERAARRSMSRKTVSKPTEPSHSGHGWNLYVVNIVPHLQLYGEMVEYSKKYELTNPLSQSCLHLLSEAHLLLRGALLSPRAACADADRQQLQQAFRESCAQLGDCFSRYDKRDCHFALPYYKMSGLSVAEVIQRNKASSSTPTGFGKGFLFYLKHTLYEETTEELTEETANAVLDIFAVAEPAQLPHVVNSPFMLQASPSSALAHLERLEAAGAPSVTATLSRAALALRAGDVELYERQMERHAEMLQVYGFIEEPKLLFHGRGKEVVPTVLARHLRDTQDGLLVATVVALHENNKLKLEEADLILKRLCAEPQDSPPLLVDFWEALLVASSQEPVIQELLFRLSSVYIDCLTRKGRPSVRPLKTAEDLMDSCCHYGRLFPWVTLLTPAHQTINHEHREELEKLQFLLCGPSLDVSSILPLLEQLSDEDDAGLSIHVLCATRLGHHQGAIQRLLERCPQAIIPYANRELQDENTPLWWQALFPELCKKARMEGSENPSLLTALDETLEVIATELSPRDFLDLLPDDGTAHFFLPYLLQCTQRNLVP